MTMTDDPRPYGRNDFPQLGAGRDVTVVLCHYDCVELLGRAVKSVMAQTHRNWELVVVDDASPAERPLLRLIGRSHDERIHWWRTSQTVGQFRIYNALLSRVASPYLALHDADDCSRPGRLETQLEEIERRRSDVLGSAVARVSLVTGSAAEVVCPREDVNRALRWRRRGRVFIGPTMLCRTPFLQELGGFDGTTRIAGDTEFIYRAVRAGKIQNVQCPLYDYTDRPNSLTRAEETGFGSPLRRAYIARLRRQFYLNLLRARFGRLDKSRLQGAPNDVEFQVRNLMSHGRIARSD